MAKPPDLAAGHRDKPIWFTWETRNSDWLDPLSLPPAKTKNHELVRSAIFLDAVLAHPLAGCPIPNTHAISTGFVSYSRNRNWWAGASRYFPCSYKAVIDAVDELALLGWLNHHKAPANPSCGWQSRFRASSSLIDTVGHPYIYNSIRELIVLKNGDKQLIGYRDTARTEGWRNEVAAQNEAISGIDINIAHPDAVIGGNIIRIGDHVLYPAKNTLYRVFNKDWKHGGRFYGGWWQNAKSADRQFITIDGGMTIEKDYHQLHPKLIYRLEGKALIGDAYTLGGWERGLCKIAFNIILNASSYQSALGAVAMEVGLKHGPERKRQKAAQLILDLKIKHQPVAQYFHSGVGLRLQEIDARMAEHVMRRLRKQGIVALPIHDSFIVPANDQLALLEAMDDALNQAKTCQI
jgi:hypothetical protein